MSEGKGYESEEVGPGRLRVMIDGDPIEVTVETTYSTHHHFGRFTDLDLLVEIVRRHRAENRDAEAEVQRLRTELGEG